MKKILVVTAFVLGCTVGYYVSSAAVKGSTHREALSAPKDMETCFAPDQPCEDKLVGFVETAQSSLDIAIYDINIAPLAQEIIELSKKIPVRIVYDQRQSKEKNSAVALLLQSGVPMRIGHQRGIMHDKFTVVDKKMLETGSFNYTNHAAQANQENQLYISDPGVVSAYETRFESMWANAKVPDPQN